LFEKRVTVIVGHFGSGKTEIALNGSLDLAASSVETVLVDLDVVKPYFRSRSAIAILEEAGVGLVAPKGEHFHADLPIIVPEIRNVLVEKRAKVIMDVGGDDTGARVLGSLSNVVPTDETDCLLVLNFRRPFTRDEDEAVAMIREIEEVSRMKVTGLVSNTHLMEETTPGVVREGYRLSRTTAERAGIPLVAVAVDAAILDGLRREDFTCPLMGLRRIVKPPFEGTLRQRTTGPLFVLN
jgi:hypothetical protein